MDKVTLALPVTIESKNKLLVREAEISPCTNHLLLVDIEDYDGGHSRTILIGHIAETITDITFANQALVPGGNRPRTKFFLKLESRTSLEWPKEKLNEFFMTCLKEEGWELVDDPRSHWPQ